VEVGRGFVENKQNSKRELVKDILNKCSIDNIK
jgi:hypothetical protein